jgi:phytoene dehydrogenase-like protein
MDKNDLPEGIYEKACNYKIRGSSGKVNIALSGMPKFTGVPDNRYINRGGLTFTGSLETMERAYDCWKHGRFSDDPFNEGVIPTPRQTLDVEFRTVLPTRTQHWAMDSGRSRCIWPDRHRQDRTLQPRV